LNAKRRDAGLTAVFSRLISCSTHAHSKYFETYIVTALIYLPLHLPL